jgi:hypothetical protein
MKIIVCTKLENGYPVLPPFISEDGKDQLSYNFDKNGIPQSGGYSIIGPDGPTVLVMVDAPEETALAMKADLAYLPMDTTDKARAATWLAVNTGAKSVDLSKEVLAPVLAIHGLDKMQYEWLIDTLWAKELIIEKEVIK